MFGGFKAEKIKPQLKMAVHRLQIASNKKISQIKNQKRDIAKLLAETPAPKEEKARIRAEALIREDSTVEAYEILQLNCELFAERMKLVSSEKKCPPDLVTVASTLIWASERVDIEEFVQIRKQLRSKYGKAFEAAALQNEGSVVNERVYAKLSIEPPPALLVQTYLERIAEEFEVDWKPKMPLLPEEMALPARAPTGHSIPVAAASGYGDSYVVPPQANIFIPTAPNVVLPGARTPPIAQNVVFPAAPASSIAPSLVIPTAPTSSTAPNFVPPGAVSIPGPPPTTKPDLPTAHIGMSIPPPFSTTEVDDDSSTEESNEYIPDSTQAASSTISSNTGIPGSTQASTSASVSASASASIPSNRNYHEEEEDDNALDSLKSLEARFADLKK